MKLSSKSTSVISIFLTWLMLVAMSAIGATHADRSGPSKLTPTLSKGVQSVHIYVTTLNIPTYQYQDALTSTTPEDGIYPYPRLDFSRIRSPVTKNYAAIVLENPYLSVTVLPSLGGRIYRIRDRMTGQDLTYRNPVIKPTRWGIRGWWLATGGIEWALPTEEHGLIEWQPWDYRIQQSATQAAVIVSETEARTGLIVWVKIMLDATHTYVTLEPGVNNPTNAPQVFQFWLNAMLSLNKNKVSDDTRFVMPASTIRIHSTEDSTLPKSGSDIEWPSYNGRDLSLYRSWNSALGFFADPAIANFTGAYDTNADEGIVRIFPRDTVPGVKLFAPRGLDPHLWTDNDSGYFELWGGITPTFWDTTTLEAGKTIQWIERWYPVSGLQGVFNYADEVAAVRIARLEKQVQVSISPTAWLAGKVVLWSNDSKVSEWPASMSPGRPFRRTWSTSALVTGRLGIQIVDGRGQVKSQYGDVP